jgi:polar amino acid transport system ATP-binding protein
MRLELREVTKRFDGKTVLDSVTAVFPDAQALVLIGPSGGGKSTLLRIIAGLETPDRGSVLINGEPIDFTDEEKLRAHRRRMGVVFQAFNLFPHLSAIENVRLPLEKVHQHTREHADAVAHAILARFGLSEHIAKRPAELSGGQKQRVAIARAMAVQPQLLLLDEPTSALDPETTAEVLDAIEQLKRERRDFLLVTHAMGFARRVGDIVAFLAAGTIIESGPAEQLFAAPSSSACQNFLARVLKY